MEAEGRCGDDVMGGLGSLSGRLDGPAPPSKWRGESGGEVDVGEVLGRRLRLGHRCVSWWAMGGCTWDWGGVGTRVY